MLRQCYHDPAAVTEELVDYILKPGLQPGAVDVFLDFISYSGGPLPEEQLQVGLGGCSVDDNMGAAHIAHTAAWAWEGCTAQPALELSS